MSMLLAGVRADEPGGRAALAVAPGGERHRAAGRLRRRDVLRRGRRGRRLHGGQRRRQRREARHLTASGMWKEDL